MKLSKRFTAIILSLALALSMLPQITILASAESYSGKCGDNLQWSFDESTGVLTITGSGDMWDYDSAEKTPWIEHYEKITSVDMPNGLTRIGDYAFCTCVAVPSISIPNSVTSIGYWAFYGCISLTTITIPSSVTSMGEGAFYYCKALASADLPNGITSISVRLFGECSSLKSIIIPDSVTSIGDNAFENCGSLSEVTLGSNVRSIGNSAFCDCIALKNIEIPPSVLSLGGFAFAGCTDLTSVYITDLAAWCSIETNSAETPLTGADLYLNGNRITVLTIPDGVTSINKCMFNGCASITSVVIPDSVTSIGALAFCNCSSLVSATIENGEIGNYAFNGCTSLVNLNIGDGLTSIQVGAFSDCTSLTSVIIPENVINISDDVFRGCSSLTSVTILNPKCEIGDYYSTLGPPETTVIHGIANSTAHTYADKNGYQFVVFACADGHEFSAWTQTKAPTCTEKGEESRICSRCGETEKRYLDALGHDFGEWVRIVTPTCTASGWDFRQCNRCDAHESRDLPMTEHTYVNGICTVCGAKDPKNSSTVSFSDVTDGAFYADAVAWAVAHEPQVTAGTDEGHFSPGNPCTRGQVVAFLWRASGCPEPKSTEHPFTDVKESAFYYKAMLWAVENGITTGASKTTFAPGKPCTRGQVVAFLWRAKGSPEPKNTAHPFTDVNAKGYYYKAMLWAVENGVTTGASKTTFAPDKSCTRGQVVTFLYRAYK